MKNSSCHSDYVIFDLDDTLINTQARHFRIYTDFLSYYSIPPLHFQDYLNKRAEGLSNRDIIMFHNYNLNSSFESFWAASIENLKYLKLDKCIVDISLLSDFKKITKTSFLLLSLRSNEETAVQQFQSLPFANLFDQVVFLRHTSGNNPKKDWIRKFQNHQSIKFFIGDTDSDAEASILNNIIFLGVATGWKVLQIEPVFKDINSLIKEFNNEYKGTT